MAHLWSIIYLRALDQSLKLIYQTRTTITWSILSKASYADKHLHLQSFSTKHRLCSSDRPVSEYDQNENTEDKFSKKKSNRIIKLHNRELSDGEKDENREFIQQKYYMDDQFGFKRRSQRNHNSKDFEYPMNKSTVVSDIDNLGSVRRPSKKSKFYDYYKDSVDDYIEKNPDESYSLKEFQNKPFWTTGRKWENKFGTLNQDVSEPDWNTSRADNVEDSEDVGDMKPHIRLSKYNRRYLPVWYGRQIQKLGKQGKIKEAIAVLEDWMLVRDRVKPDAYVFSVLIGVLGRAGYTKKAFHIFNQMKKMGLEADAVTYTSLFNACSNSPWKEDGLERARHLQELMREKQWIPNLITARSMIKAFGICGDLPAAFSVMDDIVNRYKLDQRCFSSLLIACISDKQNGMKLALEAWQLMHQYKIKPNLFLYNLLLRAVRECGIENVRANNLNNATYAQLEADEQVKNLVTFPHTQQPKNKSLGDASCSNTANNCESYEKQADMIGNSSEINLMPETPTDVGDSNNFLVSTLDFEDKLDQLISKVNFERRENRMALIGGIENFLQHLEMCRVKPDIKTFALLLDNSQQTTEAEDKLLVTMETYNVQPDQEFFNSLIRKRCLRKDMDSTKAVLQKMAVNDMHPNIQTFEYLAISCNKHSDGLDLMKNIEEAGSQPTVEIFTSLIRASGLNFYFKRQLLEKMESLGTQPTRELLDFIENDIDNGKILIVKKEKDRKADSENLSHLQEGFKQFMIYYTAWLKRSTIPPKEHPWAAFR